MMIDAFRGACEGMVLVSNDSDLKMPVEFIVHEAGIPVTVLHPVCNGNRNPSADLKQVATASKTVTWYLLPRSQFPLSLSDVQGIIPKPPGWYAHCRHFQAKAARPFFFTSDRSLRDGP